MGLYGIGFWLPSLIKASGISNPVLVAIPYTAATIATVLTSRNSDRTGERRWHIALPALAGAAALVVSTLVPQTPTWAVLMLTIATVGIVTGLAQFWVLPPAFLGGAAAAAGIALINSIGNLAGFAGPYAVGMLKDATGSYTPGLLTLTAAGLIAMFIVLLLPHDPSLEHPPVAEE